MGYIDLSEKDLSFLPFGKHLMTCALCQEEFQKAKKVLTQIDVHIPMEAPNSEQSKILEREVHQMLRKMKLKELEKGLRKFQSMANSLQYAFKDLATVAVSKKMLVVYFMAFAMFAAMNLISKM